jgi:hypothetical protein
MRQKQKLPRQGEREYFFSFVFYFYFIYIKRNIRVYDRRIKKRRFNFNLKMFVLTVALLSVAAAALACNNFQILKCAGRIPQRPCFRTVCESTEDGSNVCVERPDSSQDNSPCRLRSVRGAIVQGSELYMCSHGECTAAKRLFPGTAFGTCDPTGLCNIQDGVCSRTSCLFGDTLIKTDTDAEGDLTIGRIVYCAQIPLFSMDGRACDENNSFAVCFGGECVDTR